MKLRTHIAFALLLAAVAVPAAYSSTAANQPTRANARDVVSRHLSNQAQSQFRFVTENSASQNRVDLRNAYGPPDPWQYRFVTENSASQNRVDLRNAYGPPDPWQYRFVTENSASQNRLHAATPSSTGYRFITENSASQNRLPSATALRSGIPAQSDSFDWIAAAIGAAGTLTLIMLATAALRGMHRTRRHEAPAT
jgi:hypothetical protein